MQSDAGTPFDRRLFGIGAALAILHFVMAVVAGAASRVFQTTFADWACVVLTQPANALVQHLPELSPTVQWVAFGANSILWGFCLAHRKKMVQQASGCRGSGIPFGRGP
jgi:hypothetical protein